METKECTSCKQTKELDKFVKNKRNKTGVGARCKQCHCIGIKQKNSLKIKEKTYTNLRCCKHCKCVKPLEQFKDKKSGFKGKDYICESCNNSLIQGIPIIPLDFTPTRKCQKCKEIKTLTLFRINEKNIGGKGRDYVCLGCDEKIHTHKVLPFEKTCYSCKETKPLKLFKTRSILSSGKENLCIKCSNENRKPYKKNKPIPKEKVKPTHRICYTCKETKILEDFVKREKSTWGFGYECKLCKNIKKREPSVKSKQPLWISRLKDSLRKRNKKYGEINLTNEFLINLYEKQKGLCYYTGIEMKIINSEKNPEQISLDRVDSNLGYTENNVVLCCFAINLCKNL